MTKIRRGSSLTTFVYWNQPKLKRGEKVKVSASTLNLAKARVRKVPKVGDTVVATWYFTQGPCRKRKGLLIRVYTHRVYREDIKVAVIDFDGERLKVEFSRVSKGKP